MNRTHNTLYIVDGVPFNVNNVQNLSSKDIKNISTLKDKSATPFMEIKEKWSCCHYYKEGKWLRVMNESYKEIENQLQTTQSLCQHSPLTLIKPHIVILGG